MKRLSLLLLLIPACAIGEIEEVFEKVDGAMKNLDASSCILVCNEGDGTEAGGAKECRDECDVYGDQCMVEVNLCEEQGLAICEQASSDKAFDDCVDVIKKDCDQRCADLEEMCEETCLDVALQCVSACVKEMEDEFKDINLK